MPTALMRRYRMPCSMTAWSWPIRSTIGRARSAITAPTTRPIPAASQSDCRASLAPPAKSARPRRPRRCPSGRRSARRAATPAPAPRWRGSAGRGHRAPTAYPRSMADTLIWDATGIEIHKVVVGPVDNNVYVLRCTETGEAVLLDAANEHEKLLELCRGLGVTKVLETHGHFD